MKDKPRLLRITTLPASQKTLLNGQLGFFKRKKYKVMAVSADGPDALYFSVEGIPHHAIPLTNKFSPFRDISSLIQLLIILGEFKPDIVHTHTAKAGLIGMVASRIAGVPIRMHTISRVPQEGKKGLKQKLMLLGEKITYSCATNLYPNSRGLKELLESRFNIGNKARVVGSGSTNGIDTGLNRRRPELENEAAMLREKYGIAPHDLVFGYIGSVVYEKGIAELVEAFIQCREHLRVPRKLFLLVAGPIPDNEPLDSDLLQFLTDDPNVILAGYQQETRPWIIASDIFVFPSHREGFPNIVLQACCLEVPCIVSDIIGNNEIISHHETGLIVPPMNAAALAEAMQYMAEQDNLRREFGHNARELVSAKFDQRLIWSELNLEYERLLSHSRQRGKQTQLFYGRFVKPVFDFVIAALTLAITLPVMLVCMVVLGVVNHGKIFFTQQRPGRYGKLFTMLKFRTMTNQTNSFGELLPDEARLTPVGKFIRKTSLDELPQLINVLLGQMSLVGPRPLLKEYMGLYSEEQHRRHTVKPGITGWAQVNGRNDVSWPRRFDLDVWYVKHQSFRLDLKILWLTLIRVFRAEGITSPTSATMERFGGNTTEGHAVHEVKEEKLKSEKVKEN